MTRQKLLTEKEKYYSPYCMCSTAGRMDRTEKGFICRGTGDMFQRKGCYESFEFDQEFLDEYKKVHGEDFKDGIGKELRNG